MPKKIIGLKINGDSIAAVQVKSGLKGYKITACGRVLMDDNEGLENAIGRLSDQMSLEYDTCIASIPANLLSYQNLRTPFKDPKKIEATLPFEIENKVPFPVDELLVDFSVIDRSEESEILAVSVKKTYISKYLAGLNAAGINPEILETGGVPVVTRLLNQDDTPDNGLFLDLQEKRTTMILFLKKRIVLIRSIAFHSDPVDQALYHVAEEDTKVPESQNRLDSDFKSLCKTIRNTIHSFRVQDKKEIHLEKIFTTGPVSAYQGVEALLSRFFNIEVEQINLGNSIKIDIDETLSRTWNPSLMDGALALALRKGKKDEGFNFRKLEFAYKNHEFQLSKKFRRSLLLLVIMLFCLAADMGVDYHFLNKRHRITGENITEVFKTTFPDVKRIVDPLQQMKAKINEIKSQGGAGLSAVDRNNKVIDLLSDISQRIPKSLNMHMTSMIIDHETVRISGSTDTFNAVNSIKNVLEPSNCFSEVKISSANLDSTRAKIKFELTLKRAR